MILRLLAWLRGRAGPCPDNPPPWGYDPMPEDEPENRPKRCEGVPGRFLACGETEGVRWDADWGRWSCLRCWGLTPLPPSGRNVRPGK